MGYLEDMMKYLDHCSDIMKIKNNTGENNLVTTPMLEQPKKGKLKKKKNEKKKNMEMFQNKIKTSEKTRGTRENYKHNTP